MNSPCPQIRSQEHRHNCDCVQVLVPDLTSPLVWTNSRQTLGIFSLKYEYFPCEKRSVLGDEAWGTVRSKTYPPPNTNTSLKYTKQAAQQSGWKFHTLKQDCRPGIHLLRQAACWHHLLGKGFKHFISQRKHLNYTITPYKSLLESFVILSHRHLDCTSLSCSTLAINWILTVRSDKGSSPLSLALGGFCLAIAPEELRLLRVTGVCTPLSTWPSLMLLLGHWEWLVG